MTTIHDEVIAAIAGVAARYVDDVFSLGARSTRRAISERVRVLSTAPEVRRWK